MASVNLFPSIVALLLGIVANVCHGNMKADTNIDLEAWLGAFGDGFTFEIPDLEEFYSEKDAPPSLLYGHRKMPKLQMANSLGASATNDMVENCGPEGSDFSLTWTPDGPLIKGNTYTGRFQGTAIHDMLGEGHVEPKVYRDGMQIFPFIKSVPLCKFVPREHRREICDMEKGDKLDYSYTGTIPHYSFLKPGHYHGNLRVFNKDYQEMACLAFDVTLY
ncbi:uncharacterized protein [Ptychodera flava]|uniref:uncharacterized protein n=1 Tax=Ptychodera flava TaxID=63121 RepID=UPI00396A8B05